MKNISVNFCNNHKVFHLQFGIGYFFLCSHQLVQMLASIHKEEPELFMHAYICVLNELPIDSTHHTKADFQLCFGNLFVRLRREELLYFLSLLWKEFDDLMQHIILLGAKETVSEQLTV